jgi:hypothetical protein
MTVVTRKGRVARSLATAVLGAALWGCSVQGQKAGAAAELASFIASEIPETAHREYVDFGGKLVLVAHELTPSGKTGPGQSVNAKFYWKPISAISPGWGLFTHLEDARGHQIRNFDEVGAFRKWLGGKAQAGLGMLELGNVYVDEQSFEMPPAADLAPEVLLVVGVWNGDMRLPVVSGPSDGHHAGIVTRIETGLEWPKVAAKRSDKEVRR